MGSGLGIEFLKHLNRCHLILHLVDASEEDPVREIQIIEKELQSYSDEMYHKPRILVLNKVDLLTEKQLEEITSKIKHMCHSQPICISTLNRRGIDELLDTAFREFHRHKVHHPQMEKPEYLEINDPEDLFQQLEIIKEGENSWVILHPKLKY